MMLTPEDARLLIAKSNALLYYAVTAERIGSEEFEAFSGVFQYASQASAMLQVEAKLDAVLERHRVADEAINALWRIRETKRLNVKRNRKAKPKRSATGPGE